MGVDGRVVGRFTSGVLGRVVGLPTSGDEGRDGGADGRDGGVDGRDGGAEGRVLGAFCPPVSRFDGLLLGRVGGLTLGRSD